MSSTYDIVNESPFFKDWYNGSSELSPDVELEQDQTLWSLRKSSAKLIKNNFIAGSAQLAYINTILGGELKFDAVGSNSSFNKKIVEFLKIALAGVDISRQYSITQLTEQEITAAFASGDVLVNLPIDKFSKRKVKTYIELIEASRIKTPPKYKNNTLVKEGVHYYSSGRLKGYWVIKRKKQEGKVTYLSAKNDDFEFFPVYKKDGDISRKVCQLFKAPLSLRPGQSRGIPVLTGCMGLLRYFNQYLEAVLVGARVAACFSAFVKTNNPAEARKSLTESGDDTSVGTKGKKLLKLQPGTISYLKPNEDIEFASPNKPSDNFDKFILRLARFVSMYIRIPYEQFFIDLSEVNYSSWRGGSLETERNINRWKRDLTSLLHWQVMTLIQEALIKGELEGDISKVKLVITFPIYKTLDEEKTARARRLNIQTDTTSQHREQAGLGEDYDQLQKELDDEALVMVEREAIILKRQKELSEKYGIIFPNQETEGDRDTSTSRREGESDGTDLDEEDADERRKDDGNW